MVEYVVKIFFKAAFMFSEGKIIEINFSNGESEVRNVKIENFLCDDSMVISNDFHMYVEVLSDNVNQASNTGVSFAREFLNFAALVSNCQTTIAELVYAVEKNPSDGKKQFFQPLSVPPSMGISRSSRKISANHILRYYSAIRHISSDKRERVFRAAQQYFTALYWWDGENFVWSVAHAYMAAEALFKIVRDSMVMSEKDIFESEVKKGHLRSDWRRRKRDFSSAMDTYIRREYIFHGDVELLRAAKKISDGLEHGFGSYKDLVPLASEKSAVILGHIRKSIMEIILPDDLECEYLFLERMSAPVSLVVGIAAQGNLRGDDVWVEGNETPIDISKMKMSSMYDGENTDLVRFSLNAPVAHPVSDVEYVITNAEIK